MQPIARNLLFQLSIGYSNNFITWDTHTLITILSINTLASGEFSWGLLPQNMQSNIYIGNAHPPMMEDLHRYV